MRTKKVPYTIAYRLCVKLSGMIKMISDLLIVTYAAIWLTSEKCLCNSKTTVENYMLVGLLAFASVDFIFTAITIAGVSWIRFTTLKMFYYYSVLMAVTEIAMLFLIGIVSMAIYPNETSCKLLYIFFLFGVLWIFIDIVVIVILQAELLKQVCVAHLKLHDPKRKERDTQKKLEEAGEKTAMWNEQT